LDDERNFAKLGTAEPFKIKSSEYFDFESLKRNPSSANLVRIN